MSNLWRYFSCFEGSSPNHSVPYGSPIACFTASTLLWWWTNMGTNRCDSIFGDIGPFDVDFLASNRRNEPRMFWEFHKVRKYILFIYRCTLRLTQSLAHLFTLLTLQSHPSPFPLFTIFYFIPFSHSFTHPSIAFQPFIHAILYYLFCAVINQHTLYSYSLLFFIILFFLNKWSCYTSDYSQLGGVSSTSTMFDSCARW